MVSTTTSSPQRVAQWLTLLGVIPFLALVAMLFVSDTAQKSQTEQTVQLLTTYAAVILSFLGGIQWGLGIAVSDTAPRSAITLFFLSVVPSLLAWTMLFVSHPTSRILVAIFLFGFVWTIDTLLNLQKLIPSWFYKLRSIISFIVIVTLAIAVAKI